MTSDVFVSYAREDSAFVRELYEALRERGREPWVDWEGIPPTARWMEEIESAIVSAAAFAFVISSHSLASRVCSWELQVATEHHKRLIPLVREEADEEQVPQPLRDLNWLFFRDGDLLASGVAQLVEALDTHPAWLRFHARLETRAMEWQRRARDPSLLLRGRDLREVMQTLEGRGDWKPDPTPLQEEYVLASRELGSRELAQRKARELTALAGAEQETGNDEVAALLARQAFLLLDPHGVSDRTHVDKALREILAKPFFCKAIRASESNYDWIRCVAFSPDDGFLAVGYTTGAVRLWKLGGKLEEPAVLRGEDGQAYCVAFSHDGALLAVGRMGTDGSPRALEVWDLAHPGGPPWVLGKHGHDVTFVAFTPEGQLVSAGGDGVVRIWDLAGESTATPVLEEPNARVRTGALSRDGRWLAVVLVPNAVLVWSLHAAKAEPKVLEVGETDVNALAFSADGQWLATGNGGPISGVDDAVRLWRVADLAAEPRHLGDHPGGVQSMAFGPEDEFLATGGHGGDVVFWEVDNGNPVQRLEIPGGGWVEDLAFSHDGRQLAAGNANTIATKDDIATCVWSLEQPLAAPVTLGEHRYVFSLALSATAKRFATADFDGTVRVWTQDAEGGQGAVALPGSKGTQNGGYVVAIGGDDHVLAGGGDGRIRLWDLSQGVTEPIFEANASGPVAFTVSGDRFATASGDSAQTLRVWNRERRTSSVIWTSSEGEGPAALAFSVDGQHLAAACYDGAVRLFDVGAEGGPVRVLRAGRARLAAVTFGKSGQLVAAGGLDRIVFVWDLDDPQAPPRRLVGHSGPVEGVAFSPEDELLASASRDKTVRLWNLAHDALDPIILKHKIDVYDVAFFPSDPFLLTAGGSSLHVWTTETRHLADLVCQAVWRDLTKEEWLRYVGDELPYEKACADS